MNSQTVARNQSQYTGAQFRVASRPFSFRIIYSNNADGVKFFIYLFISKVYSKRDAHQGMIRNIGETKTRVSAADL
jgi:hypothetical protein